MTRLDEAKIVREIEIINDELQAYDNSSLTIKGIVSVVINILTENKLITKEKSNGNRKSKRYSST
jgi:hypothetical protein